MRAVDAVPEQPPFEHAVVLVDVPDGTIPGPQPCGAKRCLTRVQRTPRPTQSLTQQGRALGDDLEVVRVVDGAGGLRNDAGVGHQQQLLC